MRVVHIYKDYWPVLGGIENHIRLVAERQALRGLQVTVLVTSRDRHTSRSIENGVEVIRAARLATFASTPISFQLFRELASIEADVAHLHFPYPMGELAHYTCGKARSMVITYHSDIVRQRLLGLLYRPIQKRVLDRAHRLMPTSPAYVETSTWLSSRRKKCTVVPLGIELAPFLDVSASLVAEVHQRHPGPLVLFVGQLRYYKGLGDLIEAMRKISGTLLIVGTGPMESAWSELASQSPAADRIRFLGQVSDRELPAHISAADVLVLPSNRRSEAFGLVQVEAMAAATAVVSTELGTGTSFVNVDGETGLVVPANDPAALARAVSELLQDDQRRQAMASAGRRRACELFSADRLVDQIIDVYEQVSGV